MKKLIILGTIGLFITGCSSTPIVLPSNVSTVPSGMGQSTYIDHIDYSFSPTKTLKFSDLKVCAATIFTNDGVILKDSAGSFVGAYTGNYYHKNNSQSVSGGDVFKLIDDENNILIATGNKKTKPQQGGLVTDFIKYDAKIRLNKDKVSLVFQNIQAAQQSTGSVANDGFRPIGTWSGARAPAAIETLDSLATGFKGCLD